MGLLLGKVSVVNSGIFIYCSKLTHVRMCAHDIYVNSCYFLENIQSTLHNSDWFYPDFCIFRTELLSPISFLLKCNTEKIST